MAVSQQKMYIVDIEHELFVERMVAYNNEIPPLESHQQGTAEWKEARRLRLHEVILEMYIR